MKNPPFDSLVWGSLMLAPISTVDRVATASHWGGTTTGSDDIARMTSTNGSDRNTHKVRILTAYSAMLITL